MGGKKAKKSVIAADKIIKEEPLDEEMEVYDRSDKVKETKKKIKEDMRMSTRPRRDSTSSLTAAVELKAKKEDIGEACKTSKDIKKKVEKVKDDEDSSINSGVGKLIKVKKETKKKV